MVHPGFVSSRSPRSSRLECHAFHLQRPAGEVRARAQRPCQGLVTYEDSDVCSSHTVVRRKRWLAVRVAEGDQMYHFK